MSQICAQKCRKITIELPPWHSRLVEELHLLVVEGLGVGPALDCLLAEQRGVDGEGAPLAVLHELGQVEHRLGYLRQIANHQSLDGGWPFSSIENEL